MFRKLKKDHGVVMLSQDVVMMKLSAEALGCLVYMSAIYNDGEMISVGDLMKKFEFGQSKWRRISRELKDAGILKLERTSNGSRLVCVNY